jgi:Uma2 family endonuclease
MEKIQEEDKKWTYEELQSIEDGNRYERHDGELVMIASPVEKHQDVVLNFGSILKSFFKGKKCKPFVAPFDVDLFADESYILQPDALVVCDENKRTGKNIQGAPDLVVEVLSPSTESRDRGEKLALYKRAGVREYIIVDTENETVWNICFSVEDTNQVKLEILSDKTDEFETIFEGLVIKLADIFE